jgi:hypothetical protein
VSGTVVLSQNGTKRPVRGVLVSISTHTEHTTTDTDGHFSLPWPNELSHTSDDKVLTFDLEYFGTNSSVAEKSGARQGILLELSNLPVAGSVVIYQQPLRNNDSVAVLDAVVRNFSDAVESSSGISIELALSSKSCKGPQSAGKVDDLTVVDLDSSSAISGGTDAPIVAGVRVTEPFGTPDCVRIEVPATHEISANGVERYRFDIRSKKLRGYLNNATSDDPRYYLTRAVFHFEALRPDGVTGDLNGEAFKGPGDLPK